MIWKILATLLMVYIFWRSIRVMSSSAFFLAYGKRARPSPVFEKKFGRGFLVFMDANNVLMNITVCLWCVIFTSEIWMDVSYPLWILTLFSFLGIYLFLETVDNNRKITKELHDAVTNFKVITDLPEDVQESYGNAKQNLEQGVVLLVALLVCILFICLKWGT